MDLTPLITAGGGLGALAMVVIYLLGSNRADRKAAREELAESDARADAAEARERDLQLQLDDARAARRAAEDREAALAREVAGLREEVAGLRAEVERLRAALGAQGSDMA